MIIIILIIITNVYIEFQFEWYNSVGRISPARIKIIEGFVVSNPAWMRIKLFGSSVGKKNMKR